MAQPAGTAMVLLDTQSGQYFELNASAAWMMDKLLDGQLPAAVARSASQHFAVSAEAAEADLQDLLERLKEMALLA